jgi:hypothetical protein
MTASLPSEIKPEQFTNHYGENWSNSPPKMNIEEYNEFIKYNKRQKLNLTKFDRRNNKKIHHIKRKFISSRT